MNSVAIIAILASITSSLRPAETSVYLFAQGQLCCILSSDQTQIINLPTGHRLSILNVSQHDVTYPITDHLGSTIALLSARGAPQGVSLYWPYGKRLLTNGHSIETGQYTGKPYDNHLEMIVLGARHFDPEVVRMSAPDPLAELYSGQTPYQYALGNPMLMHDPSGKAVMVVPLVLGFVNGAALDVAFQMGMSMAAGQSFGQAFSDIQWSQVLLAGAVGAVTIPPAIRYIGRLLGRHTRAIAQTRRFRGYGRYYGQLTAMSRPDLYQAVAALRGRIRGMRDQSQGHVISRALVARHLGDLDELARLVRDHADELHEFFDLVGDLATGLTELSARLIGRDAVRFDQHRERLRWAFRNDGILPADFFDEMMDMIDEYASLMNDLNRFVD